jgi:polyferredoxin
MIVGIIFFGFVYSQLSPLNPNPISIIVNFFANITGAYVPVPFNLSILMLLGMILLVIVSNRIICGWGCQLGLLQDSLYRISQSKKLNTSKYVTLWTRVGFFLLFLGLLFFRDLNLLSLLDPFSIFKLSLSTASGILIIGIITSSVFFYRPWCRFFCPFGLAGLVVEQWSLYRPRIDEESCSDCMQCVKACPSGAMQGFYFEEEFHNDCFACGECIDSCKVGALSWSRDKD